MNTMAISRPDITQSYKLRADNTQKTSKEGKLDDHDYYVSNVAGVIGGIVAGVFATIGGFFLLGIFGANFLSVEALLGGSLLIGAVGAVGGFFLNKYAVLNGRRHSVADHHTVKPVKASITTPSKISPSKLDYCKKQFKQFGNEYGSAQEKLLKVIKNNLEEAVGLVKDSLEQNKISQEMAESFLENCKGYQVLIAMLMNILGDDFTGKLTQFGKVLSMPTLTKESYHTALNKFTKIVVERTASQKEVAKKHKKNLKEGGEKLKQQYPDENLSELVDTLNDKLSANFSEVIRCHEIQCHKLLKLLGGFEKCF